MRDHLARLASAFLVLFVGTASSAGAQVTAPEPPGGWPVVTVHGETWTQATLLQRNLGGRDDQSTAFPPHRIAGNIYYVGTNSLATFLIATPQGHILINSSYERNVPVIRSRSRRSASSSRTSRSCSAATPTATTWRATRR